MLLSERRLFMNILLTGGSGFIGSHFRGDNRINRIVAREGCGFEHWDCEKYFIDGLSGQTDWNGAFLGTDVIIHLAALAHDRTFTRDDFQQVNVDGTLNLARKAVLAGVKRLVFVSSIGVHGSNTLDRPLKSDSPLAPNNEYAQSKLSAELGLKQISHETGLEIVIVRPVLVYGSNAPGNFSTLTKFITRTPILPFGAVFNKRSFIAVENLKDLLYCCATHPNAAGHTFLASDGETISIKEFTNAIADGLGKKVFQLPVPVSLMRLAGRLTGKSAVIEQLYGNLEVDSSNIKEILGWTPPLTMKQAMATLRDSGVK